MTIDRAKKRMNDRGWIGVDLDGTIAEYDVWMGETHVGPPVPLMLARVKLWIETGRTVKIFTARVSNIVWQSQEKVDACRTAIQDWTELHLGVRLDVVCEKDFNMIELWDDRAVQVNFNTGVRADGRV